MARYGNLRLIRRGSDPEKIECDSTDIELMKYLDIEIKRIFPENIEIDKYQHRPDKGIICYKFKYIKSIDITTPEVILLIESILCTNGWQPYSHDGNVTAFCKKYE